MTPNHFQTVVPAEDVRVGDDLVFLGQPHRITSSEEYRPTEWPDEVWRSASDAYGWSMTLVPGQRYEVVR